MSLTALLNPIRRLIPSAFKTKVKNLIYSTDRLEKIREDEEIYRLSRLPRYEPCTTKLHGKKIEIVDTGSYLFIRDEIFVKEIYKFKSTISNPYVIDGGANIGLSVIYFKTLYPLAKVIAFEPDPKVFSALKHNINEFGLSDVEMISKALWHTETILSFYSEGADGGRISNEESDVKLIQINTVRLSNFLDRKVDLLKLDIEGAEYEVLTECRTKLNIVQNIFVEYHSFPDKEQCLPEILEILKTAGFRLYLSTPGLHSDNPFVNLNTYLGMDLQVNIFGLRSNNI